MTVADYYGVNMVETGEDTTNSLTRGERAAHLFHWRPSDCWAKGKCAEKPGRFCCNQILVGSSLQLLNISELSEMAMEREGERERESTPPKVSWTPFGSWWAFTQQLISTDNLGWKVTQRIFTGPTSKNLKVKNTYNHTRTIPIDIHSICFYMHDPQSSWWLTTGSVFGWTGVEMHMQAIPFPATFNTSQTKPLWKFIGCIYIYIIILYYIILYIHTHIYIYIYTIYSWIQGISSGGIQY